MYLPRPGPHAILCAEVRGTDITFTSRSDAAVSAVRAAASAAAARLGETGAENARALCPVRTGRLRDSISFVSDGSSACVGTDVEYAAYVELGTARQAAHSYLAAGVGEITSAQIEAALKGDS